MSTVSTPSFLLSRSNPSEYSTEYISGSSLPAALVEKRRVLACLGWASENSCLFEQPAKIDPFQRMAFQYPWEKGKVVAKKS